MSQPPLYIEKEGEEEGDKEGDKDEGVWEKGGVGEKTSAAPQPALDAAPVGAASPNKTGEVEELSAPKKSAAKSTTKNPAASRLPEDWRLPAEWRQWAAQYSTFSHNDICEMADRFKDYWLAKSSKDASKRCWFATWRNWVRQQFLISQISPMHQRQSQ